MRITNSEKTCRFKLASHLHEPLVTNKQDVHNDSPLSDLSRTVSSHDSCQEQTKQAQFTPVPSHRPNLSPSAAGCRRCASRRCSSIGSWSGGIGRRRSNARNARGRSSGTVSCGSGSLACTIVRQSVFLKAQTCERAMYRAITAISFRGEPFDAVATGGDIC